MSAGPSKKVVVLVAAAIVAAVSVGVASVRGRDDDPLVDRDVVEEVAPEVAVAAVVERWLDAWSFGDVAEMEAVALAPAAGLAEQVTAFRDAAGLTALRFAPRAPEVAADRAAVTVDVAADLEGAGTWTYTTVVPLVRDDEWRVQWSRAVLHPALTGERRVARVPIEQPRAPLLAADGTPLSGAGAAAPPALAAQLVRPLDAAFGTELGGLAPLDIQVVDDAAGTAEVVDSVAGVAPRPVRTSIDLRVQRAAEEVLGGVGNPAALVAIRPSTGEVVASVSNPVRGFNRALEGRYPPGSTFKVITTTALLGTGITPDSPASCPEVARISGREFRNAEGAALGDIQFRRAFYESCNTAFVQLAAGLEATALIAAAERYGFNEEPATEVPAALSQFPAPAGIVDQASAAIGQGRVLATPLQMASVAATVASGARRQPTFRAVDAPAAGQPLDAGVAPTLQELMRLAVAQGTGTAARLPGEPVAGKTGTAEFGTADPPRTHAWFIGFRGDLALAVVVEDGGFGGRVAAPLAREVFARLG